MNPLTPRSKLKRRYSFCQRRLAVTILCDIITCKYFLLLILRSLSVSSNANPKTNYLYITNANSALVKFIRYFIIDTTKALDYIIHRL